MTRSTYIKYKPCLNRNPNHAYTAQKMKVLKLQKNSLAKFFVQILTGLIKRMRNVSLSNKNTLISCMLFI